MYLSYKIFTLHVTMHPATNDTTPTSDDHTGTTLTKTIDATTTSTTINQKICFLLIIFKFKLYICELVLLNLVAET